MLKGKHVLLGVTGGIASKASCSEARPMLYALAAIAAAAVVISVTVIRRKNK